MLSFRKMHGLGNDFVILDARDKDLGLSTADMERIADRHFGVGCDQIAVISPSDSADAFVRYYNADGSESGACGNASRCVADIIMSDTGQDSCSLELTYGTLSCRKIADQMIEVNMGAPKEVADLDLSRSNVSNPVSVNMGNPHCVFFVDSLNDTDVESLGDHFEHHEAFPNRTNVEFVEVINRTHVRQKTWERGAGVTLACGSGACAVAVAAVHRGLTDRKVEIELDGGTLTIEYPQDGGDVLMTGPVAYVFDGVFQM